MVEVLTRRGFGPLGKRYRSKAALFGLPVIDIALGPHHDGPRGKARGIIAIGDIASGWLAIGGMARGIVAIGGLAIGVFALGSGGVGVVGACGGGAIAAGIAVGGGAVGTLAEGGAVLGIIAQGGGALGLFVRDYHNFFNPAATPPIFSRLSWLFGPAKPTPLSTWQPMAVLFGLTLVPAALIGLIASWRLRR